MGSKKIEKLKFIPLEDSAFEEISITAIIVKVNEIVDFLSDKMGQIDEDGIMCAHTAAIHTNQSVHAEQPWYISIHPVTLDDDIEYAKALMRKGRDNITQEDLRGNMSIAGYDAERKQIREILRSSHPEIEWQAWAEAINRKGRKSDD